MLQDECAMGSTVLHMQAAMLLNKKHGWQTNSSDED